MPGQFLPADHSRGDANTIGGYMAVHARPAAFEGSDGYSYSVELAADRAEDRSRGYGAFFLFLRWRRIGAQGVEGHLETDYLAWGESVAAARESLGRTLLSDVRRLLEERIQAGAGVAGRRWWDVMRDPEDDV